LRVNNVRSIRPTACKAWDNGLLAPAAENLRRITEGATVPVLIEALRRLNSVAWWMIAAVSMTPPISDSSAG